ADGGVSDHPAGEARLRERAPRASRSARTTLLLDRRLACLGAGREIRSRRGPRGLDLGHAVASGADTEAAGRGDGDMGPTVFLRRLRRIAPRSDGQSDAELRERMVREQIESRGIRDPRVLDALRRIPREKFVPEEIRRVAHGDHALPIGAEQTISQPYMVALMTEKLQIEPHHRVLEIGTGSGY